MKTITRIPLLVIFLIPLGLRGEELPDSPASDPVTGLAIADGWKLVRANCTACHSARLVSQQSGDQAFWAYTVRSMQEKQNLWELEPDVKQKIIDYLATNYPPRLRNQRRGPLSPELMPDAANGFAAGRSSPLHR
jgi:mono/diheme cytochrome c family protein